MSSFKIFSFHLIVKWSTLESSAADITTDDPVTSATAEHLFNAINRRFYPIKNSRSTENM